VKSGLASHEFRLSEVSRQHSDFRKQWTIRFSQPEGRMQYFVVMIDYGRRGREAVVDPKITRDGFAT
jgi:hypothetical protein